jgi:hypothetical protein
MSKIKINPNSKFDPKQAMELANLIERSVGWVLPTDHL